ncbi:MAG: hypothetical protein AAF762_12570 [Pseudomonadota bacterium]
MNTEAEFAALLGRVSASDTAFLTELGPLVLSAVALGLAADTRSLARAFEVAHAHVIRECSHLADDLSLVTAEDRGETSGRLHVSLTEAGRQLARLGEAAE